VIEEADFPDRYQLGKIEPTAKRGENAQHHERTGHYPRRLVQMRALRITGAIRAVEGVQHHARHVRRRHESSGQTESP
jgi:hypothetical protein